MKWSKNKIVYIHYRAEAEDCALDIWRRPGGRWSLRIICDQDRNWPNLPTLGEPARRAPGFPVAGGVLFESTYRTVWQAKRAALEWLAKKLVH